MNEETICTACGTYYSQDLPEICPICEDDRQYVPENVQTWTTHARLAAGHSVKITKIQNELFSLQITPSFAIGQRAFFLLAPEGNVLWDCIPMLDKPTIEFIKSRGGLTAIVISHPHFYSNMNDWADVFDCPIFIHQNDEEWVNGSKSCVEFWTGDQKDLWNGIQMINVGGHFPGSCILRVPFLSGEGTILCGDTFVISPSKNHIAAMHSYPNKIPLPVNEIRRIRKTMRDIQFDTIHAWIDSQSIESGAKSILENSLARYI